MLRENRKKQTRESIIKHAIALFKQKGYENVTVEEITIACGIAKGTFFNYFPKKEHILLYITDTYMNRLNEVIQLHPEGSLKERVLHIFRELVMIYFKYPDLLGLTLEETIRSTVRTETESNNLRKFQTALAQLIDEEKENNERFKNWDSDTAASILVDIFIHTLLTQSASLHAETMMELFQRKLNIIWEGLAR
ncbi:TetR/AcrR family transcriptional regulator [Shimazuella sp. AN120528]|uniref:TetR/AcrR family transcriptional regulator n=1 Tax=Shimazuella soli TaxID=1892854 RepID=UPI001F0DB475|nr:TetR/AcrR family transcriptional regulator [Shimazuella soli]MCH5583601.1 TetR/AcrR family transcriptional regulator [Shimazuella soli]